MLKRKSNTNTKMTNTNTRTTTKRLNWINYERPQGHRSSKWNNKYKYKKGQTQIQGQRQKKTKLNQYWETVRPWIPCLPPHLSFPTPQYLLLPFLPFIFIFIFYPITITSIELYDLLLCLTRSGFFTPDIPAYTSYLSILLHRHII